MDMRKNIGWVFGQFSQPQTLTLSVSFPGATCLPENFPQTSARTIMMANILLLLPSDSAETHQTKMQLMQFLLKFAAMVHLCFWR